MYEAAQAMEQALASLSDPGDPHARASKPAGGEARGSIQWRGCG